MYLLTDKKSVISLTFSIVILQICTFTFFQLVFIFALPKNIREQIRHRYTNHYNDNVGYLPVATNVFRLKTN